MKPTTEDVAFVVSCSFLLLVGTISILETAEESTPSKQCVVDGNVYVRGVEIQRIVHLDTTVTEFDKPNCCVIDRNGFFCVEIP